MNDKDEYGEDLEEIRIQVWDVIEQQEARNAMPYDGILGSLPEWVPEPIQKEFESKRNYVLDFWGYKPTRAVKILDQFLESSFILRYSEKDRKGESIDSTLFSIMFGFLHRLRWVLEFQPEDALYLLAGEYAVSGYRSAKNLGKRKIQPTTLKALVTKTATRLTKFHQGFPGADQVLDALTTYDDPSDPIILNITTDLEIEYRTLRGKDKSITMGRFRNIVSEVKKEYSRSRENVKP